MAASDGRTIIHVVEVALLLVAFGCCMAAAITIGLTSNQMDMCVLRASARNIGGNTFEVTPSNDSRCQFCVGVQVIGILLALVFIIYRLQVICRRKCEIQVFGRFIVLVVFGILTFFIFVEACLVSAGLNYFCGSLVDLDLYDTCAGFQKAEWSDHSGNKVNGAHFYDYLKAAEAASWISVLLWLSLVGISLLNFCLTRRLSRASRAAHTAAAAAPVVT